MTTLTQGPTGPVCGRCRDTNTGGLPAHPPVFPVLRPDSAAAGRPRGRHARCHPGQRRRIKDCVRGTDLDGVAEDIRQEYNIFP